MWYNNREVLCIVRVGQTPPPALSSYSVINLVQAVAADYEGFLNQYIHAGKSVFTRKGLPGQEQLVVE